MKINGTEFYNMILSGANALDNNKIAINNLNVFPVPDGDTGINMSMTLSSARELAAFEGTVSECADKLASLTLRSARGNSGVILSLFFRGMAKSLNGIEVADSSDFACAFERGTQDAYRAVMNPTEGTMLTVMRVCAERAMKVANKKFRGDVKGFFTYIAKIAEDTLQATPELLPVLKQAGVVDAGGSGFVTVLNGMLASLNNHPVVANEPYIEAEHHVNSAFEAVSSDIKFGYCTECLVEKKKEYIGEFQASDFNDFLISIGDSVVFVDDEEIIKVHVHTNDPGSVLTKAVNYGSLIKVKVENMRKQHSELLAESKTLATNPPKPSKKYGFVSVCMGSGIAEAFEDLGVDSVVYGGQTMNPSTQDIINAINNTSAENVFVLPNNKNIYLVSKQAKEIIENKNVVVFATATVPQGISVMLAFDEDVELEENITNMEEAINSVKSMSMTYAVRDSQFENEAIASGQILGLIEGKICCACDNQKDCMISLAENMKDASYISIFYGENVNAQAAGKMKKLLEDILGRDTEIVLISGGQPLYDYIISVE